MDRKQCLDAANKAVMVDRSATHGDAERSFSDIAAMWSVIFGVDVAPHQVTLALAALKIVRANGSPAHADNWVDLAGYAACGAEISGGD